MSLFLAKSSSRSFRLKTISGSYAAIIVCQKPCASGRTHRENLQQASRQ